jgi:hypothetical protein
VLFLAPDNPEILFIQSTNYTAVSGSTGNYAISFQQSDGVDLAQKVDSAQKNKI